MSKVSNLEKATALVNRITMQLLGIDFFIVVAEDKVHGGRIYVQASYKSPCTNTGDIEQWKGRKYYLSEYMTDDEVIKTCYVAFEQAVKHEVMEGFKVDGIILFNPHINYEELLKVSHKEIKRN